MTGKHWTLESQDFVAFSNPNCAKTPFYPLIRFGRMSSKFKDSPGPGSYTPFSEFGTTAKKLSFGGRTHSLSGKIFKPN